VSTSLEEALKELEASDPDVATAAQRYDDEIARALGRDRISRFKRHRAGECHPETCEYRH
jgi:hypothetical protein